MAVHAIRAEDLRPGDLICFGACSHVVDHIDAYSHPVLTGAFAIVHAFEADGCDWSYALWHGQSVDVA